jgi:hypothetical protein
MASPIKPLPMRGTVDPAEAKKEQEKLYGNIADVASNLPYGGVVADALGFTKTPNAPSAPAVVTQPTYRASGSPEQDIQSGLTTSWAEPVESKVPGVVSVTPAAPPTETPKEPTDQEKQLAALRAMYSGMRGAPTIGMNKDILKGIAGQQEALQGPIGVMEGQMAGQEAARAGMQQVGQQYIGGLEKLGAQRQQLFDARRGAMAEEERRLSGEEKSFDASRVVRDIGKNPVGTAALSFAAGLVGALKGSAGDMSANQILGEVDKAVERDVMNQKEQYSRMLNGMSAARTNFLDARQMGADENAALAASTLASMDQHKRALEFAEQRISGAKEKAALRQSISALDLQRGKIRMDIDAKNAANFVAMNRVKGDGLLKVMEMEQKMKGLDPETRQKTLASFQSIAGNERFDNAKAAAEAVGKVRNAQMGLTPEQQKSIWSNSIKRVLTSALSQSEAKNSSEGNVVMGAVSQYMANEMKNASYTPEEIKMLNLVQSLVNTGLKNISGGSVTTGEGVRDILTRSLNNYENFSNWIDSQEQSALNGLKKYQVAADYDPNVKTMMDGILVPALYDINEYRKTEADMSSRAQTSGVQK